MKYIIRNVVKDEYIKYRDIATKLIQENSDKKLSSIYCDLKFRNIIKELAERLKELEMRYQAVVIFYIAHDIIENDDKQKEVYLKNKDIIDTKYNKFMQVIDRIISIDKDICKLITLDVNFSKRK